MNITYGRKSIDFNDGSLICIAPNQLITIENGQYDKNWKYIHMLPEEVVQAAEDLNAKQLLTVHSSKFALANHAWQEPLERVTHLSKDKAFRLLTPIIGESVFFLDSTHNYQSKWW